MTPAQFRSALDRLGLTQARAGAVLGVSRPTCERWATGRAPMTTSAAKLLTLILRGRLTIDEVEAA